MPASGPAPFSWALQLPKEDPRLTLGPDERGFPRLHQAGSGTGLWKSHPQLDGGARRAGSPGPALHEALCQGCWER